MIAFVSSNAFVKCIAYNKLIESKRVLSFAVKWDLKIVYACASWLIQFISSAQNSMDVQNAI